jgi:crotonobetainyl-CoA:carnitine CoA-transferase CaiB-like acyl-CoA transferase
MQLPRIGDVNGLQVTKPLLHGIRVLDLSRVLAGPYCAMMLGDLGADVIKVERPRIGDESRAWGPPFDDRGESAYFLCTNRNKLGITLDFDSAQDRDVAHKLIAEADVVLDNFRAGMLEGRGIEPDRILEQHPRLVWCTLSGFGPDSDRPGYDFVVQAEAGWMSITGEPDGQPMKVGVALADVLAGKDAAIAILAALAARQATPNPSTSERRLHVSLAASARSALINVGQNHLLAGTDARRWGNAHPNLVPYQLFQAADRAIVIAVGNDGQWERCCRALELTVLGEDVTVRTNPQRLQRREHVVDEIARQVAKRPASSWISALQHAEVPCGLVRSVREALAEVGASPLTGIPPSIPGSVRLAPPLLGEHNDLVRSRGFAAFSDVRGPPGQPL